MRVKDVMTREVVTCEANETIADAARSMARRNVGSVVVTDGGRVVGLLTDRQIVVRVVGEGRDPASVPVDDVMTSEPCVCRENDSIFDVARTCMEQGPFRRVPVVGSDGKPVGILSVADLAVLARPLLESVLAETAASLDETRVRALEGPKEEARQAAMSGVAR